MAKLFADSGDPDQRLHSAASDLDPYFFANYPFRGFQTKIKVFLQPLNTG